ncbi:MAG TPA: glycosyltransferase family 39 protein [Kofleriaceae bacterium]|nr:glycosyltransferase family 39 protein [Kofleriaceae bacterium]
MQFSPSARTLRIGFALGLALVAAYLIAGAFEPFRTNWGDPWSDGNAMTAGRYFAEDGFVKTAFTPVLDVGPLDADSLRYTHYPPLPDLVAGVVQKAIGPDHLAVHRLLAIGWSALALLCFFRVVRRLWTEPIARLAVLLFATNLLFIQYADTVHHIPLYLATGFAALDAALRWLDDGRRRALATAAALTFLCFLASYDFYFMLTIMVLAAVRLRGARWLRGPGLALVLAVAGAGLAAIVVKNLLVIWAEGVAHWKHDLVFQFFERATSAESRSYREAFTGVVFWRAWRFFSPLFLVVLAAQALALTDRLRGRAPAMSFRPLLFLAGGVPFLVLFSQLVVEQYHPMLQLLPFAAVGTAVLVDAAWRWRRPAGAALVAFYLGWQGWQLELFHKTFLEPRDVAAVARVLERDHHRFLMSDILVDGPVRYLWHRHLVGIAYDPILLRDMLEIHGDDSPLTIVQLKGLADHMFDKGIYPYFAAERRWSWIERPVYYRPNWRRRFRDIEETVTRELADLGTVVYESPAMRVRQVSTDDLDRVQAARLPAVTPTVIDFETAAGERYRLRGISQRVGPITTATGTLPGFVALMVRQPARMRFTLHGYDYVPTAPPIVTSALRLRWPAGHDLHLALDVSSPIEGQRLSVQVNGREVAHDEPVPTTAPRRLELDVPAAALAADGLQTIELTPALTDADPAQRVTARLHRLAIEPTPPPCASGAGGG